MQRSIKVLHEDKFLIVFDKPAGIVVIPSPKKEKRTLVNLVNEEYGPSEVRLHPCHRLDQQTSGAIIFAKGKKNQQLMMQEFQNSNVSKKYIVLVKGKLYRNAGTIDKPIADYHQRKFAKRFNPKPAVTQFKVVKAKKGFSIVEVWPLTGRTNQIRIHLKDIGNPVLGERVYAFRKEFDVDFKRLALHASQITFKHPVSKKKIKVVSELPDDMAEFIERGY